MLAAAAIAAASLSGPGPMDFNCTTPPLLVTYGAPISVATCGSKYTKTNPALATAPMVTLSTADATAGYVLMMIDPDAPSRTSPTAAPIRHWLVGNIAGADLLKGDVSKGDALSPYHPPGPPPGTSFHRYAQFIFKQPTPTITFAPVAPSIAMWNYTAFIEQYNLGDGTVSSKLSSNYFLATADPVV